MLEDDDMLAWVAKDRGPRARLIPGQTLETTEMSICTLLSQAPVTVRQVSSLDLKQCASKSCSKSGPCTDRIIESPNLGVLQDVQKEE